MKARRNQRFGENSLSIIINKFLNPALAEKGIGAGHCGPTEILWFHTESRNSKSSGRAELLTESCKLYPTITDPTGLRGLL